MHGFGNKLFIFLFGMTFGLLVGGGVMFYYENNRMLENLKGNDENKSLSLINKFIDFAEKKMNIAKGTKDEARGAKTNESRKLQNKNDSLTANEAVRDTLNGESTGEETIQSSGQFSRNNANRSAETADSLENTTSADSEEKPKSDEEKIVVRKDELLQTKMIDLLDADFSPKTKQDSMLIGEGIPHKVLFQVSVEYWKSPINYKGYKMGKNKLILFGVYDFDSVKLIRLNNAIYMKYGSSFYKLLNTDTYLPLMKVTDDLLLLKLNQW